MSQSSQFWKSRRFKMTVNIFLWGWTARLGHFSKTQDCPLFFFNFYFFILIFWSHFSCPALSYFVFIVPRWAYNNFVHMTKNCLISSKQKWGLPMQISLSLSLGPWDRRGKEKQCSVVKNKTLNFSLPLCIFPSEHRMFTWIVLLSYSRRWARGSAVSSGKNHEGDSAFGPFKDGNCFFMGYSF